MVPARQSKRCRSLTRTRKPGLKTTDEFHSGRSYQSPRGRKIRLDVQDRSAASSARPPGGGVKPSSTNHVSSVAALTINGDDPCGTSFSQASAIDRPVEEPWRLDPIVPQGG